MKKYRVYAMWSRPATFDRNLIVIVVEQQGREQRIEFDALVCAVGRIARLKGYGLEDLGIATERTVATNEYLETLYPNIFAAGDVAGPYQFTHVAAHQAWYATIHTYPTLAEANKYAAGEWKRAHAPQRLLAWLEKYHNWKRGGISWNTERL